MASVIEQLTSVAAQPQEGGLNKLADGLQIGMGLAQRRQQLEFQKKELDIKKQEFDDKRVDHLTGLYKLWGDKNLSGGQRNLIGKMVIQRHKDLGKPIDEDTVKMLTSNPTSSLNIGDLVNKARSSNLPPDQQRAYLYDLVGSLGLPFDQAKTQIDQISDAFESQNKLKEQQNLVRVATGQKIVQEGYKTAASTPGKIDANALRSSLDATDLPPEVKDAAVQAAVDKSKALGTKQQSTVDLNESKIEGQKSLQRYRDATLAQRAQALDLRTQGLDVSKQRLALNINNKIVTNPIIQKNIEDLQRVQRGRELLNQPVIRWIDLSEAASDLNRVITGSARAAVTTQEKLDFKSVKRDLDTWRGKISNKEEGGPSPQEVANFRQRLDRLGGAIGRNYDLQLQKVVSTYANSAPGKAIGPQYFQDTFNIFKTNNESAYQAPQQFIQSRQAAPQKVDLGVERQRAQNALNSIRSGKGNGITEDMVKQKFKQKTGQDL